MQRLRNANVLARWVLAWFALSLGVAAASPLVRPQAIDLVCSAAGTVKLVVKGDLPNQPSGSHLLDCPLCLLLGAPPPAPAVVALPPARDGAVRPQPDSVPFVARAAAPLPARGPPAVFRFL